jgi:hypothetical protein
MIKEAALLTSTAAVLLLAGGVAILGVGVRVAADEN